MERSISQLQHVALVYVTNETFYRINESLARTHYIYQSHFTNEN